MIRGAFFNAQHLMQTQRGAASFVFQMILKVTLKMKADSIVLSSHVIT